MKKVEAWQAKKLATIVGPMVRYLYRLKDRMEKTGYGERHPMYLRVVEAYEAVLSLHKEIDLTAVGKGNGRPPTAMG
jgi:hypothetical protein